MRHRPPAPTLAPSYASYGDDEVVAVWLTLPKGTYALRTRMRATIAGQFTEPPATAEMLYQPGISAATSGAAGGDRAMSNSVDDSPPLHDPLAGKPHPESKLQPPSLRRGGS